MKSLNLLFRPALIGGLIVAVLLLFPAFATADFVTITRNGAPVPGGDSVDRLPSVSNFVPLPILNDAGEVVFLMGLSGDSQSNRAILRGTGGPLTSLARTGGLTPDGVNTYTLLGQPVMNNNGHVVFYGTESPANVATLYRHSDTNALEIAQVGDPVSHSTMSIFLTGFSPSMLQFPPRPNSQGHLAFKGTWAGGAGEGMFLADDTMLRPIALFSEENHLGGSWLSFADASWLNDSYAVAFAGQANYPNLSLRTAIFVHQSGMTDLHYCFEGDTEPGGDGRYESGNSSHAGINQRGEFPLSKPLTGTSAGATNNHVLYRASISNQLVQIVRRGDPAPDGTNRMDFTGIFTPKINEAGEIAFTSALAGPGVGSTNNSGIFVGNGGPLTQIAIENQLAPTTTNTLAGRFDSFPSDFAFNDAGQVAWATTTQLRGVVLPAQSSIFGLFTGDGIELINVARTGGSHEGSIFSGFALGRHGLNRHGQLAFQATFSVRNTFAVLLWTPDLHWRFHTNGAWNAPRRWTLSLTPDAVHHVLIQPTNAVTVTGPTNDVTVRSLTLGNATLQLQAGATLTATGGVTIATNTILSGNGVFVASFTNHGTISPGASAGALAVTGDVTFASSSVFVAELGGTAPADFDRLHVQGNLALGGALQLALINGHTLADGQTYPIVTASGTRSGQFSGLGEGALVGNYGGRDLFITYTNGISLYTTGTALPNPTVVFQPGSAAVDLTFFGAPGQQYLLQRTESLTPANWITLQTLTAAPDGKVSYTDANPPAGGAFYRITPP